ncbi:MAG: hypothetical protein H0U49_06120 [Parachlamydiaceae bacterium]|nr:hypothetical protein [Parachlamydiaceae bacterium]
MSNDPFNFQKVQTRKEFRHLPPGHNMDQRKYSFDEQDHPSKSNKKFGATAIALAIVSSLCACMVGYEIVRANLSSDLPDTTLTTLKKKSLLVSKPDSKGSRFIASGNEGEDDYQLLILKEQNRQQGEKIKLLRQELMEKMQNAQEIKSSLFKYEGEAGDRTMIAELQRELTTKHQQGDQLKIKISYLDIETTELQKKITQLEVTRDTLMGMMENVQASYGHEKAALKEQFNVAQNSVLAEKAEVEKKLQVLELTQQLLADALRQKSISIEKLEEELAFNELIVTDKSAELHLLLLQHSLSDEKTRKDTLELVTNIEFELTAHEIAKQKFLTALNDKATLIAELENEYIEQERLSTSRGTLLSGLENRANENARDFILTLELEALRTQQMQLEHGQTVQTHQNQHQENKKKIEDLEATLKLKESQMSPKELEMLSLVDLHYFNDQVAANQLEGVVTSHHVESIKGEILDRQLQTAHSKISELERLQEELNHSSFASLQYNDQLSRQLAGKELQLADHELQLRLIVESHQNGKQSAGEEAQKLVDLIETEQLHNQLLAAELEAAKKEAEVQKNLTILLEARLEVLGEETNYLEEALHGNKKAKADAEQHMNTIVLKHAEEIDRAANLESELGLAMQQLFDREAALAMMEDALKQKEREFTLTQDAHKDSKGKLEGTANLFGMRLESLLLETNELEAALKTAKVLLDGKESELDSFKSNSEEQISALKQHNSNEAERATRLEYALKNNSHQLEHREADLSVLRENLNRKESDLEKLANTHQETKAKLEESVYLLGVRLEALLLESSQLELAVSTSASLLMRKDAELAQIKDGHHASKGKLEDSANLLGLRLEALLLEANVLEEALSTSKLLLDQREKDLATIKLDKDAAEQQITLLRQNHSNEQYRSTNLEVDLETALQVLLDKEVAIAKLYDALDQKENELAQTKANHHELKEKFDSSSELITNRIEELSLEASHLEKALISSKAALDQRENELATLKSHKNDAEKQANYFKEHHANEYNRASNLENHLELTSERLSENEAALTKLKEALKQKESEFSQFHVHHSEVKGNLEEMTNILSTRLELLADEASELESALEVARSHLDYKEKTQRETIDLLENDLVANLQKVIDLESSISDLKEQLEDESRSRKQLQRQLANSAGKEGAHGEVQYLKEHLAKLAEEANKLEDALALERQEKHFITTELSNAQYQLERLSKLVDNNNANSSTADKH